MSAKRKSSYRNYLNDCDVPVPRTTLWRHTKKACTEQPDSGDTDGSTYRSLTIPESPERESSANPDHISTHDYSESYILSSPESLDFDLYSTPLNESYQSISSSLSEDVLSAELPDSIPCSSPEPSSHELSFEKAENTDSSHPNSSENMFEPLYSDATISLCGAVCAIMHFSTSNKMSYTAISQLLKLLQVLLPAPNSLPTTVYKLKRFFKQYKLHYNIRSHCSECLSQIDDCHCVVMSRKTCHFVDVPIDKPLEVIVTNHWDSLQRQKNSSDEKIRDVWDGAALKPLLNDDRYFSNSNHLALSLSTDGVPLFKSSSISLWPVYLLILNLPPAVRVCAENIVLCGLYVGPTKPDMKMLLEPIMKRLNNLSSVGISITTPNGLSTVRAKLVLGIFDLPAKASVLCSKQFNGEYGCSVCLHPGRRLENGARIYLPESYLERSHTTVLAAAKVAEETGAAVDGIMGTSPLAASLDLVNSIPIDYMHCVLEGVVRMLLKFWFDSSNHSQPFYLGRHVNELDKILLSQRPPTEFSRPPRSIKKHLRYWKASELRNWLLFYSLPLLLNKLPPLFWHHYALLVCALHILLSDGIEPSQIDAAEQMISDFYKLLPELYGDSCCTHNAHLLCHLLKFVRLWGPLWTHSTFDFENKHGHLKNLFHGKYHIIQQLLFYVDINTTLQLLHPKLVEIDNDDVVAFLDHRAPRSNMDCIGDHTYIVGITKQIKLSSEQSRALHVASARVFYRLYKDGVLYYANEYCKDSGKRNNTICSFIDDDNRLCFGQIELFSVDPVPSAFLYKYQLNSTVMQEAGHSCRSILEPYKEVDLLSCFIHLCKEPPLSSALLAVNIEVILAKAILVKTPTRSFLISNPNNFERH